MRLKLLAVAIMGAAITAPACGLAATTITADLGSLTNTSGINGITTFGVVLTGDLALNTYVWQFQTSSSWDALFAMQAQNTGNDPIQFELDQLVGGNWVEVAQSSNVVGAVIPPSGTVPLGAGSYRLETDQIGVPTNTYGTLDGSIALTAAAVPESATWAFLMLGIGGIGAAMRSRRKAGLAMAAA